MRQPKQRQLAPLISLDKLSSRSQNIRQLIKQAESRSSLEDIFNELLPEQFRQKFQINSTEGGILTLSCQSASLMTKFRFTQAMTLEKLNQKIRPRKINAIRIKVRPTSLKPKPRTTTPQPRYISQKNARLLEAEAGHTDDQKLKAVLLRLAQHSQ